MTDVANKLWSFCHVLRQDGMDYGDYIEQLTYLLFIKMAEERSRNLPKNCDWAALRRQNGEELIDHYPTVLRTLSGEPGILGAIFGGAQSRFNNPVNLKRMVGLVDEIDWSALGVDVKAEAFESLLERAASEGKKGAGQYFTPRFLIESIVRCVKPDPREKPDFRIGDPACGTGGFLVRALEWFMKETGGQIDRRLNTRIRHSTYLGQDLVDRPRRLAMMNLFLHGVETEVTRGDSVYQPWTGPLFDVVLTNPPFGTKGANQVPDRDDFAVATSNKQLNFLQHVQSILKSGGRAAVVVPDNVLFADQAGDVFKILTQHADVHTVLRLPRGTFSPYAPGTKTNVLFFTKGRRTESLWVYDARSNVQPVTKKDRPLTDNHFAEFEVCYGTDPYGRAPRKPSTSAHDRWRRFHIDEISQRHYKIDSLRWLKDDAVDDPADIPEPEELAAEVLAEVKAAVSELDAILSCLQSAARTG